jgi:glycosyltransferase involved in cell wall biosynthesis
LARGKPVLASTGGALPETVAAFSGAANELGAFPCLPPDDEAAWEATLAEWIACPPPPAAASRPRTWPEAAAAILDRAAADL